MSLNNFVKSIQDIMRKDSGINGDAQRIEQMTSFLFLKVFDSKEEDWEFHDSNYKSVIPSNLRWRNWAIDNKDGKALTGSELLDFVNLKLFPTLKKISIDQNSPMKHKIVKAAFSDANQYMKDGVNLRQVINVINEINFNKYEEKHAFGDIYETILRDLQSAGNSGEFYTPRAVTDFMVQMIDPKLGEKIADFACGTGGFLTSTLKKLEENVKTINDREKYVQSVYGIEKKPLPYLLAITNLLIHDIDEPNIVHGNSLEKNVRDYKEKDKFDVILMNPPYGGSENDSVVNNFPAPLRSSETADLFMSVIMYRLKKDGRAAVVVPDGFLSGDSSAKTNIKKELVSKMNLHTVIRLPVGVFSPYARNVKTNLLFFENGKPTDIVWYYDHPLPIGLKNYSKMKPIHLSEFNKEKKWWINRLENEFAWKISIKEIKKNNYNLDFRNPKKLDKKLIKNSKELIKDIDHKLKLINSIFSKIMKEIE
jgi:type I restriction enzyme M protein